MLSAEESAELRILRAKAYGPGEGLSAEELFRLEELEGRTRPAQSVVPEPVERSSAADAPPSLGERQRESSGNFPGALSERSETKQTERAERVEAPAETRPRRRWPVFVAASVGILVIGFGIGWGIWGWDSRASALAAAHGDTQAELEAEQLYDPGTVVPVAEQYGLVFWRADRSDGEELCVLITGEEKTQTRHGCVTYEQLAESMWPSVSGTVPDGEEKAGQSLAAGLIPSATGELVPFIQVWDASESGLESQYSEEELRQLREIEAAGYTGSALSILGYDGDTVVWNSWENGGVCAIVPTDDGILQGCTEEPDGSVSLVTRVDGVPTRYVVTQSGMRPPLLTVHKNIDTEYDFGSGDDPQFDDLFPGSETGSPEFDDKTGE